MPNPLSDRLWHTAAYSPNPAPLEKAKILKLLTDAFNGNRPE